MSVDRSIAVAVLALSVFSGMQPAAAQMIAKPQAEAKAAPDTKAADAAKALATGTKAFESGRTDAAVAALTAAIMSGALKNPELAKAYFYRGVAQRTQKKPGAALSDLNAAVWLRDGLSATDKAVAEDHRQALLREVAGGAGAPPGVATTPVESAAPVAQAAAPAPAADPAPVAVPAPAAVEAPAQTSSLFSWLTPDPAPPAVQATAEPAREPPPAPPAPAEAAATPPVEEKPLPWPAAAPAAEPVRETPAMVAAAPEPPAPAPPDTVGEPVASVAAVERGTIAQLNAEPAPIEKPLPWQVAKPEAAGQPPPWVAGDAVAQAPATPPVPVASAPAPLAAPETPPPAARAMSSPAPSDNASAPTETASNGTSGASSTLANAGQAATQFLGSLFGGNSGESGSSPQAAEEQPATVQAAALNESRNDATAAPPVPAAWPAETKASPAPARIETASVSKPVEEAATKGKPAWNAQTRTSEPAPAKPTVVAVAEPVPPPATSDAFVAPAPAPRSAIASESPPAADGPQPAAMPGPYRLQIAAENSRADAEQTLARLVAKHKPSLKGLEPVIEEPQTGNVLFGSMGAAYRVSLGPYQTAVEPGRLCNILQPHGFDCRVVAVTP